MTLCFAIIPTFLFRRHYIKGGDSLSWHAKWFLTFFWSAVLWVHALVSVRTKKYANEHEVMQPCQARLYCIVCGLLILMFKATRAHAPDRLKSPTASESERERRREKGDVWMGVLVWVIRVCFSALSLNSPLAQCWKSWYWILADMFPQVWEQEMRAHAVRSAPILLTHTHTHTQKHFLSVVKKTTRTKEWKWESGKFV